MGRSTKHSVSTPYPLHDGLTHQLEHGVIEYPSANAAINGLILYQLLSGKGHDLTSKIAYMHPTHQDAIHDFALELTRRGLSLTGSFLRRVAERVAEGLPEPDPEAIIKLQADQILAWAQRWQRGDDRVWHEIAPGTPPPPVDHDFDVRFPGA